MTRIHVRCPTCAATLECERQGNQRAMNVRCGQCTTVFSAELPPEASMTARPSAPSTATRDWQCPTCTLINKKEKATCSACGHGRPAPAPAPAPPPQRPAPQRVTGRGDDAFVTCPVCTLRNKLTASKCEACAAPLDSAPCSGTSTSSGGGGGGGGTSSGSGDSGGGHCAAAPYLTCPACTVHNEVTASVCATCGTRLGDVGGGSGPRAPPAPMRDAATGLYRPTAAPTPPAAQPINLGRQVKHGRPLAADPLCWPLVATEGRR